MIITKRLLTTIKNVVNDAPNKEDKLKQLRLITGSNIKTNNHLLYNAIHGNYLNIETSEKLIEWFGSYTYEIPTKQNEYAIASGFIDGKKRGSIVQYRIVDVFISNMMDNVEFDDIKDVLISNFSLDEVE